MEEAYSKPILVNVMRIELPDHDHIPYICLLSFCMIVMIYE